MKMDRLIVLLRFAVIGIFVTSNALAACPASIKGGDFSNPTELVDSYVRDDPAHAGALLKVTLAALRTSQKRCEGGSSDWCKIAEFHAKAKVGLECYAGVATQDLTSSAKAGPSSTEGQMHSGSARNMGSSTSGSTEQSNSARPSAGGRAACKGSKEFCEVQQCQQRGGRPYAHTDNLGCRVVTCGFADTGRNYGTVISAPPGAGCAGYSK